MNPPKLDRHIVIGMAGHIDHGKTSLVQALTGTNTDRLKEEIERGMTTDLGFAFLGHDITIIDVPGHEKFVKTMVAGVGTVDIAMLVIAADDGVMPQTREHVEILNLLQVRRGLVVLNKIDLVDPEWVELVKDDVANFLKGTVLENAPICPVSAFKRLGIDELKETIFDLAQKAAPRQDKGLFRMCIDRVFSVKGFGTVVAGTVLSGQVCPGDALELLPAGTAVRVRGVQVHGKTVPSTSAGFRAAINLQGVEKETVSRGDVIAEPGYLVASSCLDVQFRLLESVNEPLEDRSRVRIHTGTSEAIARIVMIDKKEIAPGTESFVQLRMETPLVAERGDRYVVRAYSPMVTIGGGVVLDPAARPHRKVDIEGVRMNLRRLLDGDPVQVALEYFDRARFMPRSEEEAAKALSLTPSQFEARIALMIEQGLVVRVGKKRFASAGNVDTLKKKIVSIVAQYVQDHPLKLAASAAMVRSQVRLQVDQPFFKDVVEKLGAEGVLDVDGDKIKPNGYTVALDTLQSAVVERILAEYREAGLSTPDSAVVLARAGKDAATLFEFLLERGDLVRVDDGEVFHRNAIMGALAIIHKAFESKKEVSISEFREIFGEVSRKFVMSLLTFSDKINFTRRVGETRVVADAGVLKDWVEC